MTAVPDAMFVARRSATSKILGVIALAVLAIGTRNSPAAAAVIKVEADSRAFGRWPYGLVVSLKLWWMTFSRARVERLVADPQSFPATYLKPRRRGELLHALEGLLGARWSS